VTISPGSAAPRVSIVIPAYNHGRFVAEAIDSVLAQDYPHVDLLVIDDGSTDDTGEVVRRYADRAQVMFQPNAGQAATINRGWALARGEIVSYLSADDRLRPTAVSHAVRSFAEHPQAVLVYGDYDLMDPASQIVRHVVAPDFHYVEMVRDLVCAPGPGVFVRRVAADRIAGWDPGLRHAPDFEYWLRLALIGPFVKIPHVVAALRVHPGSASYAATTPARAEEPVRIMESYFRRADLPSAARLVQGQSLSSAHLLAARAHIRARRYGAAVRSIHQAARLSPANVVRLRAGRLMANALINRAGHRLLWSVRRIWPSRTTT
jgi:glycosyltransferase involved in cell wall biosynthesis